MSVQTIQTIEAIGFYSLTTFAKNRTTLWYWWQVFTVAKWVFKLLAGN